jgi:hypothetical protein
VAATQSPNAAADTSANTAAVQLKSPAGQYRPGGTSSYTVAPVQHMEIATRPAATAATQAPAASAPAGVSGQDPTPAIPAVPAIGTGMGTY